MVQTMERGTEGFTQMGGEGANWIGEAPFSKRGHVFQNLGDGTYNHSGVLAIRWAVAAKTNITYKILFNDAVAMTGGQAHEGGLTVDAIARQVAAEGVATIAVVADEPNKYPAGTAWPAGATIDGREELDAVQRRLAAHHRPERPDLRPDLRRREAPPPQEGPAARPGRRRVHQRARLRGLRRLRRDFQLRRRAAGRDRVRPQADDRPVELQQGHACVSGFCPAIVTVSGARPKKLRRRRWPDCRPLPPRAAPASLASKPYSIVVTGVGGTGVVTIGAILGMAAHLEGRGCGIMDMAGLAQKGGAVYSHVKIAERPQDIHAVRIASGEADLVLGCDLVATGAKKVLATMRLGETAVVVNAADAVSGRVRAQPGP